MSWGTRAESPAVTATLRRARASTVAAYAVQGFAFAVVLTNAPTYKERLGFGDDVLTLMILGVCICAGAGSALSEVFAARFGSRRVITGGLLLAAAAILATGLATAWPALFVALGCYGLALGTVDASMNMQGIDIERAYGRSLLASFYAANAAGGVVGALSVSGAALLGWELPLSFGLVAAVIAVVTVTLRPGLLGPSSGRPGLSAHPGDAVHPAPDDVAASGTGVTARVGAGRTTGAVAGRTVAVLGVAMLAFPVADSSVASWGATFLRDVLETGAVVAPLGYGAYQATLIVSRLFGDRWVERFGRVRVVRVGGTLGALGFLAVALAPVWPVAVLGFAATGLGLGVVAPLAFSAAGDRAAEAVVDGGASVQAVTDRAVARLNVFTYVGAVLGGVLTGIFATADQLRLGFVVLAALALVSAVLASRFREARVGAGR